MSKTKLNKTAAQISTRWQSQMKGAVTNIINGVKATTENPAAAAIKALPKMKANFDAAYADGRIQAGLEKTTLAYWQSQTAAKDATNLASGVDAAMPKRQAFDQWLVSTENAGLPTIAAMPDTTYEESKAKAAAWMDYMHTHAYKKSGTGGA